MIFAMTIGCGVVGIVAMPYYMYIYSLGHFLTTKGALIDGDWGGQFFANFDQSDTKND